MSNKSLKTKLIVAFLFTGIIPLLVASIYNYTKTTEVLSQTSIDKLVAVRDIKGSAVKGYFEGVKKQILTFSHNMMIVEAMAQASGILAFKTSGRTLNDGYIYYLAGTDKTKFKRSVVPGDQLRLEVEITNLRKHWMKASGKAYVGDQLVCSSLLTCAEQKVT